MNVKQLYRRFKKWQLNPFDWSFDKNELHHCVNCENDFAGNYCPHCSQKAGLTKISWKSVVQSTVEVWGMHNRSFLYSLLQLIFRPGYFISDYINGKRQVTFPPVKMVALMGLFSVMIDHLFGKCPIHHSHGGQSINEYLYNLQDATPGWFWLVYSFLFLIPTWFLFRYSPRNAKHTLPQGFFIQVFMSILILIMDDLGDLLTINFGILLLLYYFFAYWQLFGHSLWGTFWRVFVMIFCALMWLVTTSLVIEWYTTTQKIDIIIVIKFVLCYLLGSIAPLLIGWYISKKTYERRENKNDLEISADVQTENNNPT